MCDCLFGCYLCVNSRTLLGGTGRVPDAPKEDPKDVRIRQLEAEVKSLRKQVSDHGWEASARHAQATGGWQ